MSRRLAVFVFLGLILFVHTAAFAWAGTGHRAVAAIAFQRLDKETRDRVVALLKKHPAAGKSLWTEGGINGDDLDLNLFLNAATFPDDVRPKTRFDDPSFERYHKRDDHFVNFPYTPPKAGPSGKPVGGTLLSSFAANVKAVNNKELKDEARAVALSWTFHQIGDVHQPLHSVGRFSEKYPPPDGDRGGNQVRLNLGHHAAPNLHSFWDDLLGTDKEVNTPEEVKAVVDSVVAAFPPEKFKPEQLKGADDLTEWAMESYNLAVDQVYGPLGDATLDDGPIEDLPEGYADNAKKVAQKRIALAGYRLAEELKTLFPGQADGAP